ncbi:hypothetical protein FGIG_09383 [Fasciola gigantica]|uniref:Uncharacterized protein n=1 Tax=Fasciola gigantica TaxID=46835 RepID=A0A504YES5_FASGI|nr:hypothetical protein FGIG_09383 [Fasciola gigantica]
MSKYDSTHTQATDRRKHFASGHCDSKDISNGNRGTQALAVRPKLFDKDGEWKPSRTSGNQGNNSDAPGSVQHTVSRTNGNPSTNNNNPFYEDEVDDTNWSPDANPADQPHIREAINHELVDFLRSQIASLLDEKDKILLTLDDYREQLTIMNRERKESIPDTSSDLLALQTELSDARLREAELTVAFGELQHRIGEIDRMIESDPDMEAFFNAVTISPTTLSRQKPLERTPSGHTSSPSTRPTRNVRSARESETHFSPSRRQQIYSNDYRSPKHLATNHSPTRTHRTGLRNAGQFSASRSNEHYGHGETDSDQCTSYPRSGLESPQSDSGCSLNSHTTSESRDANIDPNFDESEGRKISIYGKSGTIAVSVSRGSGGTTDSHTNGARGNEDTEDNDVDQGEHSGRPRGFISLIRRSRSTAAEHSFISGFHSEMHSPVGYEDSQSATSFTPTPTDTQPTIPNNETGQGETKTGDKFSRLRASFRQSFGFGPAKPDFRTEAFAARQGEARALLSLRETRMELLRVQSRCQTLQRHMERLEAINHSRMEELEAAVGSERELRHEIRNLQRRIFELEAEHREYKLSQRITEMELVSKLAEANLRLSQVELNNQQAAVWSELSQAHEAASNLLTPAQSSLSVYSPAAAKGPISRESSCNRPSPTGGDWARPERSMNGSGVARSRPCFEHSMSRLDSVKRRMGSENYAESERNTSYNDLSNSGAQTRTKCDSANRHSMADRTTSQNAMDQSLGSLSDLRLQTDSLMMSRTSLNQSR